MHVHAALSFIHMLLYKGSRRKVAHTEDSVFQIQEKNKGCRLFENLMYISYYLCDVPWS